MNRFTIGLGAALLVVLCGLSVAGCNHSSGDTIIVQPAGVVGAGSGSAATDYLESTTFGTLAVEVDYVAGFAPDSAALSLLQTRLSERCNKPGGVTVTLDDAIPDPGVSSWTVSAIQNLESTYRNTTTGGDTAVLYVLYLNGASDQDAGSSKVLGLSYSGSSFCLFLETLQSVTSVPARPAVERAVLIHELGHNLGLVNNGVAMTTPHEDAAHPAHDADSACVMHYSIGTRLVTALTGGIPDQFGADCIADLQAAGGK